MQYMTKAIVRYCKNVQFIQIEGAKDCAMSDVEKELPIANMIQTTLLTQNATNNSRFGKNNMMSSVKTLHILLWNLKGLDNRRDQVISLKDNNRPEVLILMETTSDAIFMKSV